MNTFLFRHPGWVHAVNGAGCEDAVGRAQSACGRVNAVALCDGASCASFGRIGAEFLSERIASALTESFPDLARADDVRVVETVAGWVASALEELAEMYHQQADSFASTLLAVVTDGVGYLCVHLGDGVIVCRRGRRLFAVSAPENGSLAHSTYLTTNHMETLRSTIRVGRGSMDGIDAFLLTSDGVEGALYARESAREVSLSRTLSGIIDAASRPALLREDMEQLIDRINPADDVSMAVLKTGRDEALRWFGYEPGRSDLQARRVARAYKRYDALRSSGLSPRNAARAAGWRMGDVVNRMKRFAALIS